MKKLYLLRHAKSCWDDPGLIDFDRPLNDRGYSESEKMAEYMKEEDYIPKVIISSTAKRTRETLEPILEELDFKGDLIFTDRLYLATSNEIRDEVEKIKADSILVVGHNPGLEYFLSDLIGEDLIMKTCQLAVIDMENMKLLDYIRPKDFERIFS